MPYRKKPTQKTYPILVTATVTNEIFVQARNRTEALKYAKENVDILSIPIMGMAMIRIEKGKNECIKSTFKHIRKKPDEPNFV